MSEDLNIEECILFLSVKLHNHKLHQQSGVKQMCNISVLDELSL